MKSVDWDQKIEHFLECPWCLSAIDEKPDVDFEKKNSVDITTQWILTVIVEALLASGGGRESQENILETGC